jgi:outer membrane protein
MKIFITFCFSLFLISSAYGQDDWSLKRCIEYATQNSFDMYQSDLNIDNAKINTQLSEQERYPSLSANTNVGWNFGRSIDPTTNSFITQTFFSNGYSLNTGASLFEGGRIKKSIEQNKLLEKVAKADKDGTANTLAVNVVSSFFEVLFAQDNYANVRLQEKSIADQIDQMQKLVKAGSRAQFELYDLEAQLANAQQNNTLAQNRIDIAFLNLKALLNLPSDYDMTLSKPDFQQNVFTNLELVSLDEVMEKATAFMPEARSLDYQVESAALGIDVAKSSFYPNLSIIGSLSTNYSNQAKELIGGTNQDFNSEVLINNLPATITTSQFVPQLGGSPYFNQISDFFGYGFGFNLGIPIYSRGTVKSNVQKARINLENIQTQRNKNNVSLRNSMMQILTDARAAKKSYEASEKTLKAREIAFENAKKRYNLGAINSYEYISIQDQYNTANTNYLISQYDFMLKVKLLDYYQGYPIWMD